ncbi:LysE family transporter [Paucibacter sp. R3-3]|uniref:LysE family transporter n=1 Tax=Roseateles agri TaxID=3098619 RepID=A0ABU5DLW6_9BURK|nr:LysE family transporter [Paucibacter sp. R3-3]MDY0746685.1 LysE family transporter [Paucibacter sp. R3-3]
MADLNNSVSWMAVSAQAVVIGLSIAAPVGPIGLLTIQRSLERGRAAGLATGLGAAVADALYGALGAYGVSSVIAAMNSARVPLSLAGAAFLLWMAWGLWRSEPGEPGEWMAETAGGQSLWGYFGGTMLLTLSNPATIFSFMAVFGALSARAAEAPPWLLVLGVFVGSALWWLMLSAMVSRLRERFDRRWRLRVQRASALLLTAFAAWQLWGLRA